MSTTDPLNYAGSRYFTSSGHPRRRHRTELEYKGQTFMVEYEADGYYAAATETDPACYPVCNVKTVELSTMGRAKSGEWVRVLVDLSELMEEHFDALAEKIERSWEEM